MSKATSPLLGYNNNVRHKNKVFHIQTEDSGVRYGHIITHLFMDGGRILKSVKTSYAEHLTNDKRADIVREMMKQQHKSMFIALRDGQFDPLLELGAKADASGPNPVVVASPKIGEVPQPALRHPSIPDATGAAAEAAAILAGQAPPAAPTEPAGDRAATVPTAPAIPITVAKAQAKAPPSRVSADEEAPVTQRTPELMLDIDSLERAAADTTGASMKVASDLPPPPSNLFREKTATGSYRAITQPPPAPARATATTPDVSRGSEPPERRYAPSRPAAIFAQARPQPGRKSLFGEDLISDKSLDEVILSYLADDLEPEKK